MTAFLGLQLAPGRHRLSFGERTLSTWCAWDTLFLPGLIGRRAQVTSTCPISAEPVTVEVDPHHGVSGISPPGALLSFLAEPVPFDGELVAGFCRWIHFLGGAAAAEAWIAGEGADASARPQMVALSLGEGFALGQRTNRALFDESW